MDNINDETYDSWNKIKKDIAQNNRKLLFKEGEIWWCSVGYNIGTEIFGKGRKFYRPVLIFRKLSKDTFICLPMTTKQRCGSWYVEVKFNSGISWVMLSQIKTLDIRRLHYKMATLSDDEFLGVKEKLKLLLKFS